MVITEGSLGRGESAVSISTFARLGREQPLPPTHLKAKKATESPKRAVQRRKPVGRVDSELAEPAFYLSGPQVQVLELPHVPTVRTSVPSVENKVMPSSEKKHWTQYSLEEVRQKRAERYVDKKGRTRDGLRQIVGSSSKRMSDEEFYQKLRGMKLDSRGHMRNLLGWPLPGQPMPELDKARKEKQKTPVPVSTAPVQEGHKIRAAFHIGSSLLVGGGLGLGYGVSSGKVLWAVDHNRPSVEEQGIHPTQRAESLLSVTSAASVPLEAVPTMVFQAPPAFRSNTPEPTSVPIPTLRPTEKPAPTNTPNPESVFGQEGKDYIRLSYPTALRLVSDYIAQNREKQIPLKQGQYLREAIKVEGIGSNQEAVFRSVMLSFFRDAAKRKEIFDVDKPAAKDLRITLPLKEEDRNELIGALLSEIPVIPNPEQPEFVPMAEENAQLLVNTFISGEGYRLAEHPSLMPGNSIGNYGLGRVQERRVRELVAQYIREAQAERMSPQEKWEELFNSARRHALVQAIITH